MFPPINQNLSAPGLPNLSALANMGHPSFGANPPRYIAPGGTAPGGVLGGRPPIANPIGPYPVSPIAPPVSGMPARPVMPTAPAYPVGTPPQYGATPPGYVGAGSASPFGATPPGNDLGNLQQLLALRNMMQRPMTY